RARQPIGHVRIDLEQIQTLEREVPDVLDHVPTHVAPEEFRTLLLAVEPAPALARDQAAQEPKGRRPVALVSPVEVFRVVAVVAEQPRVPRSEERRVGKEWRSRGTMVK